MSRRRRWPRAEAFLAAGLLWTATGTAADAQNDRPAATTTAAAPAPPAERLVLAVVLDGIAAAEPVVVRRQGPAIWMRAADLNALGLGVAGSGEVALSSIPTLAASIDMATQTLTLTRTQRVQHVRIDDSVRDQPLPITPNGWGAAINYDVTAARGERRISAGGLIDTVVYGPRGYFYGAAVVSTTDFAGQRRFTRLDTGFTAGDPGAARRITIGDLVSGATENSRPVRLGGVQIATDFGLRPDLVTFPVPAIGGTAAVPSTLDLIVNGSRRSAGTVRAGQFAVADVPVQTGVNTITVAVRDALGRETRQTVSTYVARTLLKPGLTAFSAEAGWVRTGYDTADDRYRDFAGSASVRAGVTDRLTAEAHGELAGRVGVATGGASLGLGRLGLLSASVGASVAAVPEQHGGLELAVGFERIGHPVGMAVHWVGHSRGWYDLAADGGAVTRAHALSMTLGLDLGRAGTVGLTLIDQGSGRIARAPDGARVAGPPLSATSFATASWSVRVARRISLVATAGGSLRERRSGYLSIGALFVAGRRTSGYAGLLSRTGGTSGNVEWSQVAIEPGDFGYRLAGAGGGVDRAAAELSYQGARGFYGAQVERTNGAVAARVSARGAVVAGGGGVMLADRLTGSFAVVDAQGQRGVPVYRDNHRIGTTDRRGRMIVANLPAYLPTRIGLDPLAIDATVALDAVDRWIRPAARVGVPVRFGLRPIGRAVQVTLTGADGAPVPAGSRASANGGGDLPVGLDGALYLETPAAQNRVVVHLRGGGTCVARFAGGQAGAPLARIGPVACVADPVAGQ